MSKAGLIIITDASPSINSSTSREVLDLVAALEKQGRPVSLIHPSFSTLDVYSEKSKSITCKPIFYKSKSLLLRLVSEVYMAVLFSLKILHFQKKLNIKKILYISPSALLIFPAQVLKIINGGSIYLMVRDMFPFWMVDAGLLSKRSIIFIIFKKIADLQMSTADRVGVESETSKNMFLVKYPQHQKKTEVLHNWITVKKINKSWEKRENLRLIYAGNIGHAQGIEFLKALLMHFKGDNKIEIHFIGRGHLMEELGVFASVDRRLNFQSHPPVASKEFDEFLRKFDIGLLFLNQNLKASNVPGKFMSYVMNGLPVLGSVNAENGLVPLVTNNQLGYLDSSGKIETFLSLADRTVVDVREGRFNPSDIQRRSLQFFDTEKAVNKIINSVW